MLLIAAAAYPVSASATRGAHRSVRAAVKHRTTKKAAPTIKLKLLGPAVTPVYTDGVRWAVYEPSRGVTRVMDTVAGTSVNRPDPQGCTGGHLVAMGGGELLYQCVDPECPPSRAEVCVLKLPEDSDEYWTFARFVVVDVVSGLQHLVVGTEHVSVGASLEGTLEPTVNFSGPIGTQWMSGRERDQLTSKAFFLNWHTGSVSRETGGVESESVRYWEDLDSEQLTQPLCKPLSRPLRDEPRHENAPLYESVVYAPPLAAMQAPNGEEQLLHCGSAKHVVLPYSGEPQIGAGMLSCATGCIARLTPRYPWHQTYYKISLPIHEEYSDDLQHTATMVFATLKQTGQAYSVVGRAYAAQLPWVSTR